MQSLEENKAGCRTENIKFVPADENFRKSQHLFRLIFIPSSQFIIMQSTASLLPISFITFMLCYCL